MRVLVCGGRKYADDAAVHRELEALLAKDGWITIIEGGATGADKIAHDWAITNFHKVITVRADWKTHGLAAGPIRNARMLKDYKPQLVLAFPGGKGTANMVSQARAAGVEAKIIGAGGLFE